MSDSWLPTSSIKSLHERAAILKKVRHFFQERNVLEVETPSLSRHSITDPYLSPLYTYNNPTRYLQTSPEYAMKRLLAAGSGDIYQICKAFREDEVGRQHNPEFTLLEWYRVGFNMQTLIDEVKELLIFALPINECQQKTYQDLFLSYCGIEPVQANIREIEAICIQQDLADYTQHIQATIFDNTADNLSSTAIQNNLNIQELESLMADMYRDSLLSVLFNKMIEPNIGQSSPVVVSHFPKSQAALASVDEGSNYANRFEVYYQSIELANGFNELTCAKTQKKRFVQDNIKRQVLNAPNVCVDPDFISALNHGLPSCSGVALGMDRLIMLALNKASISDVISFNYDNC